MRHVACLLCAAAICVPARAGDEQDKFEEQATTRCAYQHIERTVQVEQWERAHAIRDMEAAFPGKLPKTDLNRRGQTGAA